MSLKFILEFCWIVFNHNIYPQGLWISYLREVMQGITNAFWMKISSGVCLAWWVVLWYPFCLKVSYKPSKKNMTEPLICLYMFISPCRWRACAKDCTQTASAKGRCSTTALVHACAGPDNWNSSGVEKLLVWIWPAGTWAGWVGEKLKIATDVWLKISPRDASIFPS